MIRAVIDANIIISGLFWHGLPRQVYQAAATGQVVMVTTQPLLEELRNTLAKQKFVEYLAALKLSIDDIMTQIEEMAVCVDPAEVPPNIVRDPKDQAIIACAVGGNADFIVSGDKDLLTLVSYEGIPILTAEQFLERVSSQ